MSRLSCFEFGKQLLDTNDLDPVYILLWEAKLPAKKLRRWLLAYWCFYHVGTASWIVDGNYWTRMEQAAESKDYPRSSERRHFRGQAAIKSVDYLKSQGVSSLFAPLLNGNRLAAGQVMKVVQQWVGFGPWISFKVADMLERLKMARIAFSTEDVFLFDSPRKGALELRESLELPTPEVGVESWAIKMVLGGLEGRLAPPRYERLVNVQEAETVLCKWHSYLGGHYYIGEDIESCHKALLRFSKSKTSQQLLAGGKLGNLW